jgi:hypothetical protein
VTAQASVGYCNGCERDGLLVCPLHGEIGGPIMCIPCCLEWHARHTRVRKRGRIVVKAFKAYLNAGGKSSAVGRLALAADGFALYDHEGDTIGAEVGDITAELLEDTIRLTHPDRHPAERREAAARVTQELLALKPFVFSAPKPDPTPKPAPRNASVAYPSGTAKEPVRISYPCELCVDEVPYYYCRACRVEWNRRQEEEQNLESAKRRAWYRARRERQLARRAAPICRGCDKPFKSKRTDALYCSPTCRQRAHRKRVTDKNADTVPLVNNHDGARA